MTKPKVQLSRALALLSATLMFSATGYGSIVYDNTTNSLNQVFSPGNAVEFGDQVFLAGGDRRVTDFFFDYFLSGGSGNETAQISFYANNGADLAPGTLLYTSGEFGLVSGLDVQFAQLSGLSVEVPGTFTWTIIFRGVETGFGEQAGLVVADPPTVGSSLDDMWVLRGEAWETFSLPGGAPANFSARIVAVPEPGTYALGILGGLALLGLKRFKRRSA